MGLAELLADRVLQLEPALCRLELVPLQDRRIVVVVIVVVVRWCGGAVV